MEENVKEMFCQPVNERALLAYCINSVDFFYVVSATINESDFLLDDHRLLFIILSSLIKNNVAKLDSHMILNEAERNGVLKNIGGYEYVYAISCMELDKNNLTYYIDRVLDSSVKYKLYLNLTYNLNNISDVAKDDTTTAVDLITNAQTDVMGVSLTSKDKDEPTDLSEGVYEYLEERKDNPVSFCGLDIGFPILTRLIDGLVPGTLHIVSARPKVGKSTMLAKVASHVAYDLRIPVLIVDTEMSFEQFRPRVLAMLSGVDERKIKHGGYTDKEYENLLVAAAILNKGKLFHEYAPGYVLNKIVALYRKYKIKEKIGFAVFDYLKVPASMDFKGKQEHQLLGDITTALKDSAGELDIPFFAAAQVSREGLIADSDKILRYADVLMQFMLKSEDEIVDGGIRSGTHKLVVTDSRRGGTTPLEGIGFTFKKTSLQLSEAEVQLVDYKHFKEDEQGGLS